MSGVPCTGFAVRSASSGADVPGRVPGACRGSPSAARPAESGRIDDNFPMTIHLKTPEEIEKMREAGRLAAEGLQVVAPHVKPGVTTEERSEEHTSELQSLMRISYAVFCLKKTTTE